MVVLKVFLCIVLCVSFKYMCLCDVDLGKFAQLAIETINFIHYLYRLYSTVSGGLLPISSCQRATGNVHSEQVASPSQLLKP